MSRRAWATPKAQTCAVCSKRRRTERHHVLRAQTVRREHGDLSDPRNKIEICSRCHGRHTSGMERIKLAVLPDAAFEFAVDLLGPGKAFNRIRAEYAGEDARLDALLAASAVI